MGLAGSGRPSQGRGIAGVSAIVTHLLAFVGGAVGAQIVRSLLIFHDFARAVRADHDDDPY